MDHGNGTNILLIEVAVILTFVLGKINFDVDANLDILKFSFEIMNFKNYFRLKVEVNLIYGRN